MDNNRIIRNIEILRPHERINSDPHYHRIEQNRLLKENKRIINNFDDIDVERRLLIRKEIDFLYNGIITQSKSIDKILGISFVFIYIPLTLDIIAKYNWLEYLYYACVVFNISLTILYCYVYFRVFQIKRKYDDYNNIYQMFDREIIYFISSIFQNTEFLNNNTTTRILNSVLNSQIFLYNFPDYILYLIYLNELKNTINEITYQNTSPIFNVYKTDIVTRLNTKSNEIENLEKDLETVWNNILRKHLRNIKLFNRISNFFNFTVSTILTTYTVIYISNNSRRNNIEDKKMFISNILIVWFYVLTLCFSILQNFSDFANLLIFMRDYINIGLETLSKIR